MIRRKSSTAHPQRSSRALGASAPARSATCSTDWAFLASCAASRQSDRHALLRPGIHRDGGNRRVWPLRTGGTAARGDDRCSAPRRCHRRRQWRSACFDLGRRCLVRRRAQAHRRAPGRRWRPRHGQVTKLRFSIFAKHVVPITGKGRIKMVSINQPIQMDGGVGAAWGHSGRWTDRAWWWYDGACGGDRHARGRPAPQTRGSCAASAASTLFRASVAPGRRTLAWPRRGATLDGATRGLAILLVRKR